jgi:hypothetical protein
MFWKTNLDFCIERHRRHYSNSFGHRRLARSKPVRLSLVVMGQAVMGRVVMGWAVKGRAAMGQEGTGWARMGRVGTGRAKMGQLGIGRSGMGRLRKKLQRTLLFLTGSSLFQPKVSSDSFASTLCGYLHGNHSFVKDVKQDRRKSVSNASVEAARKEKNRLKKIAGRRGSAPQDRRAFYGVIRSHSRLKRIHEQAQRDKDATFQERSFLRNFYNFAKEAIAGTIGCRGDSPEFPVEVANRYYPEKY